MTAPAPQTLGLAHGQLAPCPASPNCVSSEDDVDRAHHMEPLPYSGSAADARDRVLDAIAGQRRAEVVVADPQYIHAEFRTLLFGFIDDVEFRIDSAHHLIHFRSASRLGRGDLGTNRRRMKTLSVALRHGRTDLRH